jgi:phospholipase C
MSTQSRRDFLKHAAFFSGAAGVAGALPAAIQKALAIDPEPGSTFLDAEHVVILMQENRSFDHAFGRLQGVRGYNDPRAMKLPSGDPVWVQTNDAGESFAPLRLNIKETNATWMGSLPHSWTDQVDASNGGKHDRWLQAKASGHAEYAKMPLTMGYYDRDDIPFYYALADAFTVCDQHFCSSLTGTTPNRLYLWTGTVRDKPSADSPAKLFNSEVDYGNEQSWTTYPERLEDAGVSWKIYQNELSVPSGLNGEQDSWLGNFTDNPIEWFKQYNVYFAEKHRRHIAEQAENLPYEIEDLKKQIAGEKDDPRKLADLTRQLIRKQRQLQSANEELPRYVAENWNKLREREQNLHRKAFTTNEGDPDYRTLVPLTYRDGDVERTVNVPKSDVLYQFRKDVQEGKLPQVSWLVAPEAFSDHPGSAWFGSWYIAEAMDILTQNPEVWKKTIFILTYDENDGYFDHVPTYQAPNPARPETGKVTDDIDASLEFVTLEQELKYKTREDARESSIGLGFRVPMVIASPWSRGGAVCSQVFDHTSVLQFLETFLRHKTGKEIKESNITQWRRTVCGDLTSAFQPYSGEATKLSFMDRDAFIEQIYNAKFKDVPKDFHALTAEERAALAKDPAASAWMPKQEPGVRRSAALPYELEVNGALADDGASFGVSFAAKKEQFGDAAAGSPFIAFARIAPDQLAVRNYAVSAGGNLEDAWKLADFANGVYHIAIHGPNGFYREFQGTNSDPKVSVLFRQPVRDEAFVGAVVVEMHNRDAIQGQVVELRDESYGAPPMRRTLRPGERVTLPLETAPSHGWYDWTVRVAGDGILAQRFAGRVETGEWTFSDPAMGRGD